KTEATLRVAPLREPGAATSSRVPSRSTCCWRSVRTVCIRAAYAAGTARASVVVDERARHLGDAQVGVRARVRQLEEERLVLLLELVAVDRNVDRRRARAGREGERAAPRDEVAWRGRGAVRGRVLDGHRVQGG